MMKRPNDHFVSMVLLETCTEVSNKIIMKHHDNIYSKYFKHISQQVRELLMTEK